MMRHAVRISPASHDTEEIVDPLLMRERVWCTNSALSTKKTGESCQFDVTIHSVGCCQLVLYLTVLSSLANVVGSKLIKPRIHKTKFISERQPNYFSDDLYANLKWQVRLVKLPLPFRNNSVQLGEVNVLEKKFVNRE